MRLCINLECVNGWGCGRKYDLIVCEMGKCFLSIQEQLQLLIVGSAIIYYFNTPYARLKSFVKLFESI